MFYWRNVWLYKTVFSLDLNVAIFNGLRLNGLYVSNINYSAKNSRDHNYRYSVVNPAEHVWPDQVITPSINDVHQRIHKFPEAVCKSSYDTLVRAVEPSQQAGHASWTNCHCTMAQKQLECGRIPVEFHLGCRKTTVLNYCRSPPLHPYWLILPMQRSHLPHPQDLDQHAKQCKHAIQGFMPKPWNLEWPNIKSCLFTVV